MGSQQPFPLSKLLFMSVKTLAGPLSRWFNCYVFWLIFSRTFISCGNKILFYQCHTKFMNICRKFLHRAKTDTLFRLSQNRLDNINFDFPFFCPQKVDCFTSCTSVSLLWGQDQVPCNEPWKGAFYFSVSSQINLDQNSKQQPIQTNC